MATPEPSLLEAARNAWPNLQPIFLTSSAALVTALNSFADTTLAQLPEQQVGVHPVINWLLQVKALAAKLDVTGYDLADSSVLRAAWNPVYRACWIAVNLTSSEMSNAQKTAMLNAYNAAF